MKYVFCLILLWDKKQSEDYKELLGEEQCWNFLRIPVFKYVGILSFSQFCNFVFKINPKSFEKCGCRIVPNRFMQERRDAIVLYQIHGETVIHSFTFSFLFYFYKSIFEERSLGTKYYSLICSKPEKVRVIRRWEQMTGDYTMFRLRVFHCHSDNV